MSRPVGYDLDRVVALRGRVREAAHDLTRIGSSDPLGAAALDEVRRLHDVLVAGWLPMLDAIVATDPLGRAGPSAGVPDVGRWWGLLPDDRLLDALVGVDRELPSGRLGHADVTGLADDPRFVSLANAITDRAATDPEFADLLVAQAASNPLIGLIAGVAAYPPGLTSRLVGAALAATSHIDDRATRLDAAAVDALLASLGAHPEELLVTLDLRVVHELITWSFLDPAVVGNALFVALTAPGDQPELLAHSHQVLRDLVVVANHPYVDHLQLPTPIAASLAAGTVFQYPFFTTSLELGDQVNLKDVEGYNFGPPLGQYEEVLDYLGLLLRDPAAATTLLAGIQPLATRAALGDRYDPVRLHHVGELAFALGAAAENEQVEEGMRAAARRSLIEDVATAVGFLIGVGATARRLGPEARRVLAQIVDGTTGAVADAAVAEDVAMDTSRTAEVLYEVGVYEAFLADPRRFADDEGGLDRGALDDARAGLRRVRLLAAGGASMVDIERALQHVHHDIVRAGGSSLVSHLDGRFDALDGHDLSPSDGVSGG